MPILQGRRAVAFAACGLLWRHCRLSLRASHVAFAEGKATLDSKHILVPTKPTGRWRPAADDKTDYFQGTLEKHHVPKRC
jgi:hypothetical protein